MKKPSKHPDADSFTQTRPAALKEGVIEAEPAPGYFQALEDASTSLILLLLIGFRLLNALSIRTFFQPDEYFQSLEPAWRIVFGSQSGAWITWVRLVQAIT
jgi:hypothetical protein